MAGPGSYWIGAEEQQQVLEVLASGHLSRYGDLDDPKFTRKVFTLEKEFARYVGTPYALATSSGTGALMCCLLGLGLKPGDEVIVPAYTFVATYSAAVFLGIVPVLCEIDESLILTRRISSGGSRLRHGRLCRCICWATRATWMLFWQSPPSTICW